MTIQIPRKAKLALKVFAISFLIIAVVLPVCFYPLVFNVLIEHRPEWLYVDNIRATLWLIGGLQVVLAAVWIVTLTEI